MYSHWLEMYNLRMPAYVRPPAHDLPPLAELRQFHVVLVEPLNNLNIGSVARAMMNLGFSNLHLVAPKDFSVDKALVTARWAEDVVRGARCHACLEEALEGMQEVIGLASSYSRDRSAHILLDQWVAKAQEQPDRATALVFGPERTGLRKEHLAQCRWFVRIPSTKEYPAYNLAQAVLLVLFEITRHRWAAIPSESNRVPATWNDHFQLDRIMIEVLERVGFVRDDSPQQVPDILMNLLRRVEPDQREMGILLAMFSQINKRLQRQA